MEKTIHVLLTEHQRDSWIVVCNADIAALKTEIERLTKRLTDSLEVRDKLIGNGSTSPTKPNPKPTVPAEPVTASEAVERLLKDSPTHEMHLDHILAGLQARFGIPMTRKNLANTLNRWLARGRKFKRTRPNTYALL